MLLMAGLLAVDDDLPYSNSDGKPTAESTD